MCIRDRTKKIAVATPYRKDGKGKDCEEDSCKEAGIQEETNTTAKVMGRYNGRLKEKRYPSKDLVSKANDRKHVEND